MTKAREIAELGQKLTVDGSGNLDFSGNLDAQAVSSTSVDIEGTQPRIRLKETDTTDLDVALRVNAGNFTVETRSDAGAKLGDRLRASDNGSISFYDDTGATAKFFWNSSTERLAVGHSNPLTTLHLVDNAATVRLENSDNTLQADQLIGSIEFKNGDASGYGPNIAALIEARASGAGGQNANLIFKSKTGSAEGDSAEEIMRLTSAGELLVGKTTSASGLTTPGFDVLQSTLGRTTTTVDNAEVARFSRINGGGPIIGLYEGSQKVGTLGSKDTEMYVGVGAVGLLFDNTTAVKPFHVSNAAIRDGLTDLGSTDARFKDIHLAGNAFVDGSVSINTTSTDAALHVNTGAGTDNLSAVLIESTDSGSASSPDLTLYRNSETPADNDIVGAHWFYGNNNASEKTIYGGIYVRSKDVSNGSEDGEMSFVCSDDGTQADVKMVLSNKGILRLGTDNDNVYNTSNDSGVLVKGGVNNNIQIQRSSGICGFFNRTSTTGELIQYLYNGNQIGAIGVDNADNVYFSGNSGHAGIMMGTQNLLPYKNGSLRNSQEDIGASSYKWRDLYLGGGVYLGGTGDANKLHDYEEGTWTPELKLASSGSATYSARSGWYTKVGNLVTAHCMIFNTAHTGTGTAYIHGLPFACSEESVGEAQMNGHSDSFSSALCNVSSIIQSNDTKIHMRGTYYNNAAGPYYIQLQNFTYLRITITYHVS